MENVPFYSRGEFKKLMRLVLFLAWCGIWTESAIRYYNLDYVDFSPMNPRIYIIPVIILVIGLWVFKPYRFFTDKTMCGSIERIAFSDGYTARMGGGARMGGKSVSARHAEKIKNTVTVTVVNDEGKRSVKKMTTFVNFNKLYKEGSGVSVICGVDIPIPFDKTVIPQGRCLCTKCGSFEPLDYKRCNMCHALLWYK